MITRFCLALRIPVEWCRLKMMMLSLAQPLVHRPDVQIYVTILIAIKTLYFCTTVDGRNPANQLRLVVYPTIYRACYIPGGFFIFLPSTVPLVLGSVAICWYHFPGVDSLCSAPHAPQPSRIFVKEAYASPFADDEGCNRWWVAWVEDVECCSLPIGGFGPIKNPGFLWVDFVGGFITLPRRIFGLVDFVGGFILASKADALHGKDCWPSKSLV